MRRRTTATSSIQHGVEPVTPLSHLVALPPAPPVGGQRFHASARQYGATNIFQQRGAPPAPVSMCAPSRQSSSPIIGESQRGFGQVPFRKRRQVLNPAHTPVPNAERPVLHVRKARKSLVCVSAPRTKKDHGAQGGIVASIISHPAYGKMSRRNTQPIRQRLHMLIGSLMRGAVGSRHLKMRAYRYFPARQRCKSTTE